VSEADRERWEKRYRDAGRRVRAPSEFLTGLDELLPRSGRALDVAGGAGRNAVWLAERGLDVTVVDISDTALGFARELAKTHEVELATLVLDLEVGPLPDGPWDLIVCVDYLQRNLFARFARLLSPGGVLAFLQPTRKNLERNPKPGSRHVLEDGELPGLLGGFEVLSYEERWFGDRHEARLVARPVSS
jgi:SAM-dependent methyltransferase